MRTLLRLPKAALTGALALSLLCQSRPSEAACANQTPDIANDLALECLIAPRRMGESQDPNLREQSMYRSLLSELSAVMALPVMAVAHALAGQRPVVVLAAAVPVGVAVYLAFALVFMRDRFALLMGLVRGRQ